VKIFGTATVHLAPYPVREDCLPYGLSSVSGPYAVNLRVP
jgi:hypothetical protein